MNARCPSRATSVPCPLLSFFFFNSKLHYCSLRGPKSSPPVSGGAARSRRGWSTTCRAQHNQRGGSCYTTSLVLVKRRSQAAEPQFAVAASEEPNGPVQPGPGQRPITFNLTVVRSSSPRSGRHPVAHGEAVGTGAALSIASAKPRGGDIGRPATAAHGSHRTGCRREGRPNQAPANGRGLEFIHL